MAGHRNSAGSSCGPLGGTGCVDGALMPLPLEITLPPLVALDLDPRKVRAVLRSAGSIRRRASSLDSWPA
jgi:hypothetical protein